jgi:putative tricarboxylic transport membrane protein
LAERLLAACTLVLAAAYVYATWRLPAFDIGDPLGPKAFPYLLGGVFAFAGALLLLGRRKVAGGGEAARPAHFRAVAGVAVATGVLFALLEPVGYLVAITAYLFATMFWLHARRPALCLLIAVLFAVGSYALFAKGLGVTLAKGLLHF